MDAVALDSLSLMEALEEAERKTLHVSTEEWHMPMITCEEPVDVSCVEGQQASAISDAIVCINVGEVRNRLDKRLERCLLSGLCGEGPSDGTDGSRTFGESEDDVGV